MGRFGPVSSSLQRLGSQKTGAGGLSAADVIVDAAARRYGVKRSYILSERQDAAVVEARHLAMYQMRDQLGWSYPWIGRFLDRDHTTVIYGCRKVELRKGGKI